MPRYPQVVIDFDLEEVPKDTSSMLAAVWANREPSDGHHGQAERNQPSARWSSRTSTTGAAALLYWVAVVWKYVAAGAPVGLGDIPPFMWVTTALWFAGVVSGAFGLRTS